MKLTRRAVVLAALCAGLLAALLAWVFLERQRVKAAEMSEPVTVVVAAQDIPARTMIEPGMVYETQRPVAALPANCAVSVREVMGRVTSVALATDEPVQRSAVSPMSASLGLAYVVPEGMRAVAVSLDPIIGVAGFLKAGDCVDVLSTFTVDKLSVTKTVLQNVELLAIGSEVVPEEKKGSAPEKAGRPKEQPNATLAVTPQQAEKLILAESEGKLRLVLRRVGDDTVVGLPGVRIDALTGIRPGSTTRVATTPAAAPRTSAPPPAWTMPRPFVSSSKVEPLSGVDETGVVVETIRGTQKTTVDVSPE